MLSIATRPLNFTLFTTATQSSNTIRLIKQSDSNLSASPKFLNYVEKYIVNDVTIMTTFYTEVDSGLQVGDRVFIVNGNYDSNSLISSNKYSIGSDGYKILAIDRCKVSLNIPYTGQLPWNEDSIDNFIKIYYVKNQREFDYSNRQYVSRNSFINKFEATYPHYQNNWIYAAGPFNGISTGDFGLNNGVTQSGFYGLSASSIPLIFPGTASNWINILEWQIPAVGYTIPNNGRIKIMNGTFIDNTGMEWREGDIYVFDNTLGLNGEWIVDITYMNSFITKSNFRGGDFQGKWNKGLYGSYDNKISWIGTNSNWGNGSVINTLWESGSINSIYSPSMSYFTEIDTNGIPVQKSNLSNNGGYGYNYFIDMDIESSTINNGNFIDCNIGTSSAFIGGTVSNAVDGFYQQWNNNLNVIVNLGDFEFCNFESSLINNAVLNKDRINNSQIQSSKSINSNFSNSAFYKSNFESDNLIKAQAYDEWNLSFGSASYYTATTSVWDPSSYLSSYKTYKFYVSDTDFERLKSLDKFYINGLVLSKDDFYTLEYDSLLSFFDRAFILDSYSDADDIVTTDAIKQSRNIICKLSTSAENTLKVNSNIITNVISSFITNYTTSGAITSPNNFTMSSIDITLKVDNTFTQSGFGSGEYNYLLDGTYIGSNVDITNTYIVDSYFDSGLFENSNWNSGSFYNYNKDNNILPLVAENGTLDIVLSGSLLQVFGDINKGINDDYFSVGDIVYLNAIDYCTPFTVTRLPNIYKINPFSASNYPNAGEIFLQEYIIGTASPIISTLIPGGVFLTSPDNNPSSIIGTNRYNYIHKLRIDNSNISSAILRRAFVSNSYIQSTTFNNSDYLFENSSNLKSLMLLDLIISNNSNSINDGLFINSYFVNGSDSWNNGIIWQSIWQSGTFSNGVFSESDWINGIFNTGMFYDSRSSLLNSSGISSYYKSGTVSVSIPNNNNVWENGTFSNGSFYDSVWYSGTFVNGQMYKSDWYNGIWLNGIFGNAKFNLSDNNFYGGTFSNGMVVNSTFLTDTSFGSSGIGWLNGVFQSGIFSGESNRGELATWYGGIFNGGNFGLQSIWIDGTFNDGTFTSNYGSGLISNTQSDYSWQGGTFSNGTFGTGDTIVNSTWFTGEMDGGTFQGKIWRNGIFSSGKFIGSATYSCVGGMSSSNASNFVNSFTQSYYGLWVDGYVTNVKDMFITDREIFTTIVRKTEEPSFNTKVNQSQATLQNALWLGGTFSHHFGQMNNCVWLDGTFNLGDFNNSSFNPYVLNPYNGNIQSAFNFDDNTCMWNNGDFNGGDFYISNWNAGNFIMGTGIGMIWNNGVSSYMNAYNIFWEKGTWKNGNWYGSSFQFSGDVTDDYTKQILFRGMSWSGTSSVHIWNIFDNTTTDNNVGVINVVASTPSIYTPYKPYKPSFPFPPIG
jgi:hypothetical protein